MMMATIWMAVLARAIHDTATRPRRFISAIHSRSAEITISRPTMIMPGMVSHRLACVPTSSTSAVTTISLSATGSRNVPKGVVCPSRRAK